MSFPGIAATPTETRAWFDSLLDVLIPGTSTAWTKFVEDWFLWGFGGFDLFAAAVLYFFPELGLGWGYGFSLKTTDYATSAMITMQT